MVQVFGNRILGGIGAPGGGMSESFGAGVSTALNQRASRQAMVGEGQRQSILAQEQAFRIEDRAAAKKRQAAAEAAAATARARAAGLATTYQSIFGTGGTAPGLGLGAPSVAPSGLDNVPVGRLPAKRPTAAPAVNISADARPAASGAVNTPANARPISGGAGRGVTGGAGSDTLGAAGPSFETRGRGQAGVAVSPATLGQMSSARPGDYQAQAGLRNLAAIRSMDAELAQTGRGIIPAYMAAQQELDDAQAAFAQDQSGENLQRKAAATGELNRLTPLAWEASVSLRRYTDRGVLAEEGAGSSGAGVRVSPIVAGRPDVSVGRLPVAAEPAAPVVPTAPSAVGEPVFSDVFGALAVDGRGNLLVDNKVMPPSDPMYPAASRAYAGLQQRQVLAAEQAVLAAEQSPLVYADPLGYRTGVAGAQQALRDAQTAVGAAPNEYARFAGRSDAPVGRLPAAPTVTIEGPNGPVTVPTISAVAEPGAGGTLALATAGAAGAEGFEQRYGPSLGAPTRTPEEAEVDEFVSSSGVDANAMPPPKVGKPGPLNKAVTDLLSMREKQVRWAQALIDAGQYEDARAVQNEITSIDAKLGAVVARQALAEARDYYAPQRLNAIWSEYERRNFEFVPTAEGIYDVYVDGQLQFPGMSMEQITKDTLAMTDQVYAEQQAALALKEAEAEASARGTAEGKRPSELQMELDKANIDVEKQKLLADIAVTQDFGIKENQLRIQRLMELTGQVNPDDIEVMETAEGFVFLNKRTQQPIAAYMLTEMENPTTGELYQTYVEAPING